MPDASITDSQPPEIPGASPWLRNALATALACDPVAVANEAHRLCRLLEQRVAELPDEP